MFSTKKWYEDKLLDPRWQRVRAEILQRDNYTCTLCLDNRSTLAIHHLAYTGNPWDIPADCLKTVCIHCHSVIHELKNHEILEVCKRHATNGKCWEVVVFTTTDLIFLYLFFTSDKVEIITVLANPSKLAA